MLYLLTQQISANLTQHAANLWGPVVLGLLSVVVLVPLLSAAIVGPLIFVLRRGQRERSADLVVQQRIVEQAHATALVQQSTLTETRHVVNDLKDISNTLSQSLTLAQSVAESNERTAERLLQLLASEQHNHQQEDHHG